MKVAIIGVGAVGAATAEVARAAGFRQVSSADGDAAALARRISAAPPDGLVLHPCGLEPAGDLTGALRAAGARVEALALYQTCAVERLPTSVAEALDGDRVDTALLHSPKAARTLALLWTAAGGPDLTRVRLLGLSAACLAPLAHLPFASRAASVEPNEAAMLALL